MPVAWHSVCVCVCVSVWCSHGALAAPTGWLRDELMRALTGTLTPDCSFSTCSECGVCGSERGNNVVVDPPPIPAYAGDWRPDTTKATTLRLTLAKRGDASLLSHLDTFRLFDRAFRRARLPISYSGGFHPKPRVAAASALPFGATAEAELFDLTFTQEITADAFADAFAPQLPPGFDVVAVTELPATAAPVSHRMRAAEYLIGVYLADNSVDATTETDADGDAGAAVGMAATQSPVAAATTAVLVDTAADDAAAAAAGTPTPPAAAVRPEDVDWPALVAATLAMDACPVTRSTNGGKGDSTRRVDLRARLLGLRLATPAEAGQDGWGKNGSGWRWQLPAADGENGGAGEAVGKGSVADRDGDVGGGGVGRKTERAAERWRCSGSQANGINATRPSLGPARK